MKLKSIILTVLLLFAFSVNALALNLKDYSISADLDGTYTVITYDNANSQKEYLEKIGYTVSSLRAFFTKNNVILMAANEQNTFQMQIKCEETDFSNQIYDISDFDGENLKEISKSVAGENAVIATVGKQKYICLASSVNSEQGNYVCTQYTTFVNGKMYVITFYDSANFGNTKINECMAGITIKNTAKTFFSSAKSTVLIVIVSLLILLSFSMTVFIIVQFIVERKKSGFTFGDEKIKRRKL